MQLVLGHADVAEAIHRRIIECTQRDDEVGGTLLARLAVLQHRQRRVREAVTIRTDLRGGKERGIILDGEVTRPLVHGLKHLIRALPVVRSKPTELNVVDHVQHHQ